MNTEFHELDPVVLVRDLPAAALKAGDLGTIVLVYTPETFEVEFATAFGDAQAVVTLEGRDLRHTQKNDVLTVRRATLPEVEQ